VTCVSGDLSQRALVASGASYLSQSDTRAHFGLGKRTKVDRVEVRWPGGAVETFAVPAVDKVVTLVEGKGRRQG
jgi:hypothetical protein